MLRAFIGLMSGTSVDAVDGVLAVYEAQTADAQVLRTRFASRPIPSDLRAELLALQQPGPNELARSALASLALTDLYAEVARELIACSADVPVQALGAHGQTVRHRPELGYTLQLIHGARLAEATGCTTVVDFRSADVAAGGQGAPLVPAFHALAFASREHRRAVVNIGGIANVSFIPAGGGSVTGFDTGPGNLLMDAWCERHLGQPYDAHGAWAATGRVLPALLEQMLAQPYFSLPPPKSTGRDLFSPQWLDDQIEQAQTAAGSSFDPCDVQATLTELTARSIALACQTFEPQDCRVCGGGAHNDHLMARLAQLLPHAVVSSTQVLGIDPGAVEALAFAWLARERLAGRPANLPAVTGARGSRVLGAVYPAPSV